MSGPWLSQLSNPDWVPKNTIALIGDSFIVQDHATPYPGYTQQTARGIFNWTNYLLGQRFTPLNLLDDGRALAGVTGNTSTQMLARFGTTVLAYSPKWVWIHATVNDNANSISSSTSIANYQSMIAQSKAIGARVIITTIPPSSSVSTAALADTRFAVNKWIREASQRWSGVYVVDYEWPYLDTGATLPTALAASSADGTHPNVSAVYLLAQQVYNVLNSVVPNPGVPWVYSGYNSGFAGDAHAWPNPLMLGTQATVVGDTGVTGNKPSGALSAIITGGSSAVSSVQSRTDAAGQWWKVAFTGDAVYTSIATDYIELANSSSMSLAAAGLTPGTDYVQGFCEFKMDASPTSLAGMQLALTWTGSSDHVGYLEWSTGSAFDGLNTTAPAQGIMATYPILIPASATAAWLAVRVMPKAANSSFTFYLGRMALRKYTTSF